MSSWLVVGLGNPGREYEATRHNVGFWAVEAFAERLRLSGWKEKSGALFVRGDSGGQEVVVAKPQTYMNRSGEPAQALASFFKIDVKHVIVVHDELDFEPGVVKVKNGGGAAGNNGVRSLIQHLGADFIRVRMGVGKPRDSNSGADFVLSVPKGSEKQLLHEAVATAVDAVDAIIAEGPGPAMNRFNTAAKPAQK